MIAIAKKTRLFYITIIFFFSLQNVQAQCWQSVVAGVFHVIAATDSVYLAGDNHYGQLGNGTKINADTFSRIDNNTNWTMIAAGAFHNLAIKTDGTLWAWGKNFTGQLGNGSIVDALIPIQIGSDKDWVFVAAGVDHSAGIKADGSLWTWGWNYFGQLGNGTVTDQHTPKLVGTDKDWLYVSFANGHSLALKKDSSLWAWGENTYGELGIGSNTHKNTPTQVGADKNWIAINCRERSSYAIKNNGTRWGWGNNFYGQMGVGNTTGMNVPTQLDTITQWAKISAGFGHCLYLKKDSTIWSSGSNDHGQLGINSTIPYFLRLSQIGTDHNWADIEGGGDFSFALKKDASLWSWGKNTDGALALGTSADERVPIQVPCPQYPDLKIATKKHNSAIHYPNPAIEVIHLTATVQIIEILSIDGKLLLSAQNANFINVSSLKAGIYFISYRNKDSNKFIDKFIKQ